MTIAATLTDTLTGASYTWQLSQHSDDIRDWITGQYPGLDGIEQMADDIARALARNARAVQGHRPGWSDMPGFSHEGLEALDFLGLTAGIDPGC